MLLALTLFYLILGMLKDVLSMQVATIPITYPIITALGIDPIWFGIDIVLMCELGMITPPVGMNLFVVHGIRPDKGSIADAIWGALQYAVIMLLFTFLLMGMPGLATWLLWKIDTEHAADTAGKRPSSCRIETRKRPRSGRGRRWEAGAHREGQSNAQRVRTLIRHPHARGAVRVLRGSPVGTAYRCARRHSGRRQEQPPRARPPHDLGQRPICAFRSAYDELPVARLRATGAVIVGKTNVPEFTLEGNTENARVRRDAQSVESRS